MAAFLRRKQATSRRLLSQLDTYGVRSRGRLPVNLELMSERNRRMERERLRRRAASVKAPAKDQEVLTVRVTFIGNNTQLNACVKLGYALTAIANAPGTMRTKAECSSDLTNSTKSFVRYTMEQDLGETVPTNLYAEALITKVVDGHPLITRPTSSICQIVQFDGTFQPTLTVGELTAQMSTGVMPAQTRPPMNVSDSDSYIQTADGLEVHI
jgi:hypothetical protein